MSRWNKSLSRRRVLQGLGTAVALPALASLEPRRSNADTGSAPLRVLYYYIPNGVYPEAWTPHGAGPGWGVSPILRPLETWGIKDDVTVVSGMDNEPVNIRDNGAHFRGTAGLLSARTIVKERIENGISADQVAAQELGDLTTFRSLQLGLAAGGGGNGLCGSSWPCAYLSNVSWSSATTPLNKEIRPDALFDRLFAGRDQALSEEARMRRRELNQSVLDFVSEDARRVRPRLGRSDQERMDEYLQEVRDLERRIATNPAATCDAGARPEGGDFQAKLEQMQDLMVLAFRCDLTRIMTFMTLNAGASDYNRIYDWVTATEDPTGAPIAPLPVSMPKHAASHHQGIPERIHQLQAISTWEVERFGRLVSALRDVPEGDGTLLDNCLVVFTSEYSDPNRHEAIDMPCIVAGGGCGAVTPGSHVALPSGTKWSNFLRTMLLHQGIEVTELGDSDGLIPELM